MHKVFVSYRHYGGQTYYCALSTTFHDIYAVIYAHALEPKAGSEDVDCTIIETLYDRSDTPAPSSLRHLAS